MHIHMLRAALMALVVLLPVPSGAQASARAGVTRGESTESVADQLLAHRQELSLNSKQVHSLTALSNRIREDRGRLHIVGFDRVPGKSVPRLARLYQVRQRARATALRLLTPDQRVSADKILHDGNR